jgi:hypothetical protein
MLLYRQYTLFFFQARRRNRCTYGSCYYEMFPEWTLLIIFDKTDILVTPALLLSDQNTDNLELHSGNHLSGCLKLTIR